MRLSRFFRRSKKSLDGSKVIAKTSGSYTHDDFERDKYRMYNSRHEKYYNPVLERSGVVAPWLQLPDQILERIFSFICPHAGDESQ